MTAFPIPGGKDPGSSATAVAAVSPKVLPEPICLKPVPVPPGQGALCDTPYAVRLSPPLLMTRCAVNFSNYSLVVMRLTRRTVGSIWPILFFQFIYSICKIHAMLPAPTALPRTCIKKCNPSGLCRKQTPTPDKAAEQPLSHPGTFMTHFVYRLTLPWNSGQRRYRRDDRRSM